MSKSTSLLSFLMLIIAFLLVFVRQWNGGADAFLLSHRNLLVPFASNKIAFNLAKLNNHNDNNNNNNNIVYRRRHQIAKLYLDNLSTNDYTSDKNSMNDDKHPSSSADDIDSPRRIHSRRKRLHQLSTLRRIGQSQRTVALLKRLVEQHRQTPGSSSRKQRSSFDILWMLMRID